MNREIKFRAWCKNNNKIFNVDEIMLCQRNHWVKGDGDRIFSRDFELMQFTGINDKDGKEIYDGDILSFDGYMTADNTMGYEPNGYIYDEESIHQVFWDKAIAAWGLRFNEEEEEDAKYKRDTRWLMVDGSCKVIGNIFEHPELLT